MTSQCAVYDFTLSEKYVEDHKQLITALKGWVTRYAFQLEKSDTDYVHYQGRVSLVKKRRQNTLRRMMKDVDVLKHAHWSVTSNGAMGDNFYVLKSDTRIDGPWTSNDPKSRYLPWQYGDPLRPWQQAVIDTKEVKDRRTINIIVDPNGGAGKSFIAGHGVTRHGAIWLPVNSDAERIIATVCDKMEQKDCSKTHLIMVDIPKAFNKQRLSTVFTAVETIKSGICSDTRYKAREVWFASPVIWVFCNFDLPTHLLSRDRWRYWTIDSDFQLVPDTSRLSRPLLP